jgi:hypothetical protein
VSFADGGVTLATADLSAGTATLTWPSPSPGTHTLQATYNGDPSFSGSSSPTVSETIAAA